jgi:hypothetical protein
MWTWANVDPDEDYEASSSAGESFGFIWIGDAENWHENFCSAKRGKASFLLIDFFFFR